MIATAAEEARLVARLQAAGCVFAEDEARLLVGAARTSAELDAMAERRASGLPLEHLLGWVEFCGLRIAVDPGVFVPRRRTELLVREAVALVPARRPVVVVDLCCGCGAVGVAIANALGPRAARLHAVDVAPAAVRCARRNVAAVCGAVYQGDLDEPLPDALRHRVDVLVANVPYVPTHAVGLMPPEARLYEPRVALDGGPDGLDVLRRVSAAAPEWLAPGGHLLVETSERQVPLAVAAFTRGGLEPRVVRSDELGATAVVGAARAPRPNGPL